MGDVTQLQQPDEEEKRLPGIDLSIIQDLPGHRQIQFKTCFLQSTDKHELDRIMDAIFRASDRQKARYELREFMDSLVQHKKTLAQSIEDQTRLNAEHEEKTAKRGVEISTLGEDFNKILVEGHEEHEKSHRRGPYEPRGWRKDKLARIKTQTDALKVEQAKEDNERMVANSQHQATIDRFELEITLIEKQIKEREELLG